jgi:hypothetical protein
LLIKLSTLRRRTWRSIGGGSRTAWMAWMNSTMALPKVSSCQVDARGPGSSCLVEVRPRQTHKCSNDRHSTDRPLALPSLMLK